MKLTYKNFEHKAKILDPFYRDPDAMLQNRRPFGSGEDF